MYAAQAVMRFTASRSGKLRLRLRLYSKEPDSPSCYNTNYECITLCQIYISQFKKKATIKSSRPPLTTPEKRIRYC